MTVLSFLCLNLFSIIGLTKCYYFVNSGLLEKLLPTYLPFFFMFYLGKLKCFAHCDEILKTVWQLNPMQQLPIYSGSLPMFFLPNYCYPCTALVQLWKIYLELLYNSNVV